MIEVEHISKRYGEHIALDDVSFQVKKGEILGFLGPNGAGKTTMMRILSGFFPSTSGVARVAGFDVLQKPLAVKSRVGYLPESPPLYTEMTVDAYLSFVARIKGVEAGTTSSRVEETKRRCGLEDVGERLIKHLSKGFRQRIGLAQALIHKPEVLILDEPTVGLDPKQIREVRQLIKDLGGDHTVILSTHILPEVGMTCGRVIILNKGRIVAVDTPDSLTAQLSHGAQVEIRVSGPIEKLAEALRGLPRVVAVGIGEGVNGTFPLTVESERSADIRAEVARCTIESGCDLYALGAQRMSLEEVFLKLTTEDEGSASVNEEDAA